MATACARVVDHRFSRTIAERLESRLLLSTTYFGDANLDGHVEGSNYTHIENGFNNHLIGWANGDLNYDGVVNGSDYAQIDKTFNTQGASFSTTTGPAQAASVIASASNVKNVFAEGAVVPDSKMPAPLVSGFSDDAVDELQSRARQGSSLVRIVFGESAA